MQDNLAVALEKTLNGCAVVNERNDYIAVIGVLLFS